MAQAVCCVSACYSNKKRFKLFNFPRSAALRDLWVDHTAEYFPQLLQLSPAQIRQRKICIKHFEEKFLVNETRRYNAVPTLFTDEEIASGVSARSVEFAASDHSYQQHRVNQDHNYHKRHILLTPVTSLPVKVAKLSSSNGTAVRGKVQRERHKYSTKKTKNLINVENIDPSLENTDPSGVDYSSDSEDDSFQDADETTIMDVEIMDYDDQVETLQSTNSIPMPAVQAIEFPSMSSKLPASTDDQNCSETPLNLCRLCCSLRDKIKTFYNIYTDNISKQMDQCLHITATKDDRLPSYICQDCYDNLQKTHSFYSSVHEVDTILKSQVGENTCPSDNIKDKVSTAQDNDRLITAQDNDKLITAQDNDKLITAQDDDKLIINIEINKEQSQFHCPFCKYSYRNKSCIIKHINQFHFQTTASDNKKEGLPNTETHSDNSNIQTQSLNNNTSLSTYTTVPVPLHPHITHSDLSNDEQLFADFNVSDLITFNEKHSEKNLTESYDSTYIPEVSDQCDVPCQNQQDDNVDASVDDNRMVTSNDDLPRDIGETVDPSLVTNFIIEESNDGYKCKLSGCNKSFKSVVSRALHQCIHHTEYILVFKCLQCKQACRNTLQITDHLMSVHQTRIDIHKALISEVKCLFSCEFCLQYYVSVTELKDHRKSCELFKNDEMKCGCGLEYSNFKTFREHYIEHHEKDNLLRSPECSIFYHCNICGALFSSLVKCRNHWKGSHIREKKKALSSGSGLTDNVPPDDDSKIVDLSLFTDFIIEESSDGHQCRVHHCNKSFKSAVWKALHQCIDHKDYILVFKCLQCTHVCRDTLQIAYHLMSVHQISTDNQEASMTKVKVKCLFSCEFCLQYYVSVKELKDHRQSCASFKNDEMKCGCGVVYSNFSTFRQHYIEHHEKDDLLRSPECSIFYQCNICDALFSALRECLLHGRKSHGWEKKMAVSCGFEILKL